MKILVLADQPSKWLWDFYEEGKLSGIDLILSCGDLPAEYLSFLVTFSNCPLLYVSGNHDHYDRKPPEGCICVEDQIYEYEGIRILGLGGCMRYMPGRSNQYTEKEMRKRVWKLLLPLWRKKGFDILLTHAPARELGDLEDLPHRGFEVFCKLMERFKPKYFLHGHVHANYGQIERERTYMETTVINAYEKYIIEI